MSAMGCSLGFAAVPSLFPVTFRRVWSQYHHRIYEIYFALPWHPLYDMQTQLEISLNLG